MSWSTLVSRATRCRVSGASGSARLPVRLGCGIGVGVIDLVCLRGAGRILPSGIRHRRNGFPLDHFSRIDRG
ncbi:hypothetical protein [Nocardia brasiliensis]|uniref:hypothetical protein n=1 Tax=Nocardia brasiliensis TaxID=37326 RepID=UPI003672C092